jgi:hypothetical protein
MPLMVCEDMDFSDMESSNGIADFLEVGDTFLSVQLCRDAVDGEQGNMGRIVVAKAGNSGSGVEYSCAGCKTARYKFSKELARGSVGNLILREAHREHHGECLLTSGNNIHLLAKREDVVKEIESPRMLSTRDFNTLFSVNLSSKQRHDLYTELYKGFKKKNHVSYGSLIAQARYITQMVHGSVIKLTFQKDSKPIEFTFGDPSNPPPAQYECGEVNGSTFETMSVASKFGAVMTEFTDVATFDGTVMKTGDGILWVFFNLGIVYLMTYDAM